MPSVQPIAMGQHRFSHHVVSVNGVFADGFSAMRARLDREGVRFAAKNVDLARSVRSPRWPRAQVRRGVGVASSDAVARQPVLSPGAGGARPPAAAVG